MTRPLRDTQTSPFLKAALSYARHGWSVFPCNGKRPFTSSGFKDATTDEGRLKKWWQDWPSANIGFRPADAGLLVIDVDGPEGDTTAGELSLLAEPTLTAETGRGYHLYFKHPGGVIGNVDIGKGLDVRADNGYVILPPSVHPSGKRYKFDASTKGIHANLPPAVVDLLNRRGNGKRPELPGVIPEGEREKSLVSLAGSVRHRGGTAEEILAALTAFNARCDPPLDDADLERIARSVARYEPAPTAERIQVVGPAGAADTWPKPMDEAAFHGLAGEILERLQDHTEASLEAILAQLLVGFGNAVGRRPNYQVEADRHHVNEFALIVGATAKGRKGTAWGYPKRILAEADETWSQCIKSGSSSGEGVVYHVRDATFKWDKRLKEEAVDDPGVEDKRLMIVETEFANAIKVMSREGNTLSATLRAAWDSGNLGNLTKNSPLTATGAHISIVGHITAEELMRIDKVEMANGFLNRFVIVVVKRRQLLPMGGNLHESILPLAGETVNTAIKKARTIEQLTFNHDAEALWCRAYEELADCRPGLVGAVLSRSEAHVVRLACLYALLDESSIIKQPHLEAALAFWEYCERSALYLFGDKTGNHDDDRLINELQNLGSMTRTDVRDLYGRNKSSDQTDAILERLTRARRISIESVKGEGRPTQVIRAL